MVDEVLCLKYSLRRKAYKERPWRLLNILVKIKSYYFFIENVR